MFPNNTTVAYNMACYHSLQTDVQSAKEWISTTFRLAARQGILEKYRKMAEADPDLCRIRGSIPQLALLTKLSRLVQGNY